MHNTVMKGYYCHVLVGRSCENTHIEFHCYDVECYSNLFDKGKVKTIIGKDLIKKYKHRSNQDGMSHNVTLRAS